MIEAPTHDELWYAKDRAEKAWRASSGATAKATFANYLSAKADYDRALIVAARARQGEY